MTDDASTPDGTVSRRSALHGLFAAAVAGVAGYVVARTSGAAHAKPAGTAANGFGYRPPASAGRRPLAAASAVPPAGQGLIIPAAHVVLVRDAAGNVHGLSATCTHQGCTVSSVSGGRITCPCHGSRFDASTGAVVNGPATRPLPAVPVVVRGGNVYPA